jgi:hypothetical protein
MAVNQHGSRLDPWLGHKATLNHLKKQKQKQKLGHFGLFKH